MKTFLTEEEVIELAYDALDMNCPNPDKVHDIALKMDMIYNEDLDMYEDVEEISLRKYTNKITELKSTLDETFQFALKYQDIIAPEPLTDQEHAFYGRVLLLISPNDESNAKLIAAAPDLLEACQFIEDGYSSFNKRISDEAIKKIALSIKKAKGL